MFSAKGEVTMKRAFLLMFGLLLGACAGIQQRSAEPPKSMRGLDAAAADPAFAEKAYVGKKPGLQKPIERTYKEQPPLVPHAMNNFDDISLEENQCLSCHGLEKYKEKNAPKLGDSHFMPDKTTVSMARYQCTTCHVPQVDAAPLVDNSFVGNVKPK